MDDESALPRDLIMLATTLSPNYGARKLWKFCCPADILNDMGKRKEKGKIKDKAAVIIPGNLDTPPELKEVKSAWVLARHYNCVITFQPRIDGYRVHSPDIEMNGVLWEMKAPEGDSRTTIGRILRRASKQSKNIVIDSHHTSLSDEAVKKTLLFELSKRRQIRKIILITKDSEIIEIK
jgi:hypothetical protein